MPGDIDNIHVYVIITQNVRHQSHSANKSGEQGSDTCDLTTIKTLENAL